MRTVGTVFTCINLTVATSGIKDTALRREITNIIGRTAILMTITILTITGFVAVTESVIVTSDRWGACIAANTFITTFTCRTTGIGRTGEAGFPVVNDTVSAEDKVAIF